MRPVTVVPILFLMAAGCEQAKVPAAPATRSTPLSPAVAVSAPKLAKLVFIDQKEACDCTRKRIEGTWAALHEALGTPASIPIERIHLDTEGSKAEAYTVLKPLMVAPGVYFVDAHDAVVDMLQGDVTAEQFAAAIKRN